MGKKTMSPKGDSIPHTHLNINNLNLSLTAMADRQVHRFTFNVVKLSLSNLRGRAAKYL